MKKCATSGNSANRLQSRCIMLLGHTYLYGSLKVHVSSLIRSLWVWIEVHLKVNTICIFCWGWNQFQVPCHFIIFSYMLLSLKWMPKVGEKRFRLSVLSFTLVTKQTPYGMTVLQSATDFKLNALLLANLFMFFRKLHLFFPDLLVKIISFPFLLFNGLL